VLPTAGRTILWRTQHTPRSLVEHLDFVTATGNVDRLVTPLCVFEMEAGGFALEQVYPGVTPDQVREATGFRYREPDAIPVLEPTNAEIEALHAVDPDRVRDIEFR
jgi:glutaconate CoA-transferase subunit B